MENSSYTLLVVDDEAGVRQSLVAYLEDSGFTVYDAPDVDTGFELFQEVEPDLVVTDLSMPHKDGLVLLKQIHDILPSMPVIVISGAGVMGDVVYALRLGASDYLIKPIVDMAVLVHAVQKSLERTRLLVENQRYRVELEEANSRLKQHIAVLEQDQLAGRFVQQSMLPATPFYAGNYVCEHRLIPSLYLSGDCIDYAFIKQRYYAFYLADISGHGSAPAFVTIWLKNLVEHLVRLKNVLVDFDSEQEALKELLDMINEELMDMGLNNHLTMIVGLLDTQTNTLVYIVAGHLPLPVVYSAKGDAKYLQGSGRPMGLFKDARWEVNQVQLDDTSSSVMLFSDGILELMPSKQLTDKEQDLLQLVTETQGQLDKIEAALEISNATVEKFELPDDVAMLSIKNSY